MTFSEGVTLFFLIFLVLGGIDRCIGNKFGLGAGFEQGFMTAGSVILAMVGMLCFAPFISYYLKPVIAPLFASIGADPSIFGGIILPTDGGGYALAMELAEDSSIALYNGTLVSSITGCILTFSIPVCFMSAKNEIRPDCAKGLLIGIITSPAGLFIGYLFTDISFKSWILNMIPVFALSIILLFWMLFSQKSLIKFIIGLGKFLCVLLTVSLVLAILNQKLDWINIKPLISYDGGMVVVGSIAIVLAGAFPFLNLLRRILAKPLARLSEKSGINTEGLIALITLFISVFPSYAALNKTSKRGITVVTSAVISGGFTFGDHLAYILSEAPETAGMLIAGKLCGAAAAIGVSLIITKDLKE